MKEYKILIRADGGKSIGLGHWSRCLFLISCLTRPSKVTLYTLYPVEFNKAFPESITGVIGINREEEFFNVVSKNDLVILDHYKFDGDYVQQLSDRGAFVVFIDDLFKEGIKSDIIINHCPGISFQQFKNGGLHTSYFLGSDYSLVADVFSKSQAPIENRLDRAILSMGGSDPQNNTMRILWEHLDLFLDFKQVDIIVGGLFAHHQELEDFCKKYKSFKGHCNLSREHISLLMKQAGVAVMSASTMALEYAHVGGLLVVRKTADNQRFLYQGLIGKMVALDLNSLGNTAGSRALQYQDLISHQRKIFDGQARIRFEKLFTELDYHQKIDVRKAGEQDVAITFAWASDQKIRAFSFSQDQITRSGHEAWFQKKLSSKDCLYYIAFLGKTPAGSVRFDLAGRAATISYLVDPQFHGKGFGRILLVEGVKKLMLDFPDVEKLVGYVMASNAPSVSVFEKLGFLKDIADIQRPGVIKYYKVA